MHAQCLVGSMSNNTSPKLTVVLRPYKKSPKSVLPTPKRHNQQSSNTRNNPYIQKRINEMIGPKSQRYSDRLAYANRFSDFDNMNDYVEVEKIVNPNCVNLVEVFNNRK